MKTKFLKVTAAFFAAASLGTLALAGGNSPTTTKAADVCSDCDSCCASGKPCPVGTCCK
ncbi:MAG: hypothetical protein V4689_13950 [Verrucomicrobiota bacterium]